MKEETITKPEFDAVITKSKMEKIENNCSQISEYAISRRMILALLTHNSEELTKCIENLLSEDEKLYFDMLDSLKDFKEKAESLLEMANAANARLLWAGSYITSS